MTRLQTWLVGELNKRNLSAREASLGAGLSHGNVASYLSGKRPAHASCVKLARFFEVPDNLVLEMAGYVTRSPKEDQFVATVALLAEKWSEADKVGALEMLRAWGKQT